MHLPSLLTRALRKRVNRIMRTRSPDFVIGGALAPYLRRWFVIPRNPIFNVYAHEFLRSDNDEALHDHPWINLSILITGDYTEHTIAAGGIHCRTVREEGALVLRGPRHAHRIELTSGRCITLFVTGPWMRDWGFHCAARGWIPWQRFTAPGNPGETGRGCEG